MVDLMRSLDAFPHQYFRQVGWVADGDPDPPLIRTVVPAAEIWRRPPDVLLDDIDASRFGEYTVDAHAELWSGAPPTPFVPEPADGGILGSVAHDLVEAYDRTHRLAGIAYWHWLLTHPDEAPAALKTERQYYFFGSLIRGRDGYWNVPSVRWTVSDWRSDCTFLTQIWASFNASVLFHR